MDKYIDANKKMILALFLLLLDSKLPPFLMNLQHNYLFLKNQQVRPQQKLVSTLLLFIYSFIV